MKNVLLLVALSACAHATKPIVVVKKQAVKAQKMGDPAPATAGMSCGGDVVCAQGLRCIRGTCY